MGLSASPSTPCLSTGKQACCDTDTLTSPGCGISSAQCKATARPLTEVAKACNNRMLNCMWALQCVWLCPRKPSRLAACTLPALCEGVKSEDVWGPWISFMEAGSWESCENTRTKTKAARVAASVLFRKGGKDKSDRQNKVGQVEGTGPWRRVPLGSKCLSAVE